MGSMRLRQLAVASATLALAHQPSPADACSIGPPYLVEVIPNGATGMPTNTQVRVVIARGSTLDSLRVLELTVRPVGGDPVELGISQPPHLGDWMLLIGRPTAPLAPATTYEILHPLTETCGDFGDPCFGEPRIIGTFTTGDGPDVTPPVFGGLAGMTAHWNADTIGSCGWFEGYSVVFDWNAATDDSPGVRYNMYVNGNPSATMVKSDSGWGGVHGWIECASDVYAPEGIGVNYYVAPGAAYVVRAVDLAGNEDTNDVAYSVGADCDHPPAPDAAPPEPDAGTGGGAEESSGGCSTGGAGGGLGSALAALALALAIRARRCRRACRAP